MGTGSAQAAAKKRLNAILMSSHISMDAKATRRSDRRRTISTSRIVTTKATRAGAKEGSTSCREDFVGVQNVIRVEQLFDLLHRQHRLA
jgi:hypothetical protein